MISLLQVPPNSDAQQTRLREGLGLTGLLELRECWLFEEQLHLEIYPHSETSPTLIFLPGIGTYVELYAELLSALNSRGFNIVAIDPPGHGFSAGQRGRFEVIGFAEQMVRLISALETRFKGPWGAYGYSIGAVSALALAERDERIETLICGTLLVSEYPPDLIHSLGWSWTSLSAFWFPSVCVPLRSFIDFEKLLSNHPAGRWINQDRRIVFDYPLATLANLFSHKSAIFERRFSFRLCVMQGDCDEVLPIEYAQRVKEESEHPIQLEIIAGAGHMLPWDDPAKLAQRISDYFKAR